MSAIDGWVERRAGGDVIHGLIRDGWATVRNTPQYTDGSLVRLNIL